METVACLRSKCHLKQNLIPSWPWSCRHNSCISDFRCKTKYTNKKFCRTPGPAYLAVLPVLVIFCLLSPTNFKKSVIYKKNVRYLGFFSPTMQHTFVDQYSITSKNYSNFQKKCKIFELLQNFNQTQIYSLFF